MAHKTKLNWSWELALAIALGGGSGLLFLGVGWRLIMRAIVLMAGQSPSFWWLATLGIVGVGTIIGMCSALLFLGLRWLTGIRGVKAGIAFGLILFAVLFWQMPDSVRRELQGYPEFLWHSVALFALSFVAHGMVLGHWLRGPAPAQAVKLRSDSVDSLLPTSSLPRPS